ncbi:hypothetical protein [Sulfurospirillum barnesii]|uniref:Methyltransferase family protein n=1 Tax=Sulfurospirillum barnesii (strain ATCC 700032 / DSM 10660 / SES-3) TaxID=760154 RepID=I3XVT5_SULBS|nr:hypothetical protein [Sulfurospirillum barnesii]AFL68059.1 hypothetical protein Sulba_0754 [Sulfurospirillum barnesii SES-3]
MENEVFECTEESLFYQKCLEELVFKNAYNFKTIVEFGSGDGMPVIEAMTRCHFDGFVYGFEYSAKAYEMLLENITKIHFCEKYRVKNQSFFDAKLPKAEVVIANPPYIPYLSSDMLLPHLWGGEKGCTISKEILHVDIPNVMMLIASYSNPIELINYAHSLGYRVADFLMINMSYGVYSSEPKIKEYRERLATEHCAFFHKDYYKVAGVLFQKKSPFNDKKEALIAQLIHF